MPPNGVNITGGETNIANDLVAGSKNTYYIVLVGQLLDLARVQDLIPDFPTSEVLGKTQADLEAKIQSSFPGDSVRAVAFAGEVMEAATREFKLSETGVLRFRYLLARLPSQVINQLQQRGYWENVIDDTKCSRGQTEYSESIEVFWLHSLQNLWAKKWKTNQCLGLACTKQRFDGVPVEYFIVRKGTFKEFEEDPRNFSNEQFRLFLVGLTIDLIRIASAAAGDLVFWDSFVNYVRSISKTAG